MHAPQPVHLSKSMTIPYRALLSLSLFFMAYPFQ
jgi:hypothetical protein